MKTLSRAEMRQVVAQWQKAGPELERIRRERLRQWQYDWRDVDALLAAGDRFGAPRTTSGLVEMQRRLKILARP
ncbi:MAG: hypothetical protein V1790_04030 [Planctomycetota bacterium]